MNITYKIYLRKDHQNVDGSNTLCLRIIQKRKVKSISLHIKVKRADWNEKKGVVKKSDTDYLLKNKYIRKYEDKARTIISEHIFKDKYLSLNEFVRLFKDENYNQTDFFTFIEKEIEKRQFAADTYRTYKAHLSKIKKFRNNLSIQDINLDFISAYKSYMINVLENKASTYNKSLAILKNFINWAIQKGVIEKNPFEHFKIKKTQSNREFLTLKELDILENFLLSNKLSESNKVVLKYFLFSCYTGLRYRDIKNLKYKNIKENKSNDKPFFSINILMHKTKTPVSVPLIKRSQKFLSKNGLPEETIFKVYSNQVTNRHLKEIMKIAGINKSISFHCARHTFATIGMDLNIGIEIVSKMLGHTDIKTTQIYAKIRDNLKFQELSKLDNIDIIKKS